MNVLHQRMPDIKAMSLNELFTLARMAAAMSGRKFD
jgi:hypothetical protein